ncbi:hypothetical protein ACFE04_021509 [Oxalis oulophora]
MENYPKRLLGISLLRLLIINPRLMLNVCGFKILVDFPPWMKSEELDYLPEPCIVFSLHWSLRLGLTLHLLHRWCQDEKSLLVLENELNPEIALLSLKPMEMKVLQCSFLSGIK